MLLETLDGIGFLLLLPFLMIDLVVASNLMSMGMMMLPRLVVPLPFKLIFFVLIAGNTVPPTLLALPSAALSVPYRKFGELGELSASLCRHNIQMKCHIRK